jgi:hypothetical protein
MNNSDLGSDSPINFYERYTGFSDQQIKEVLKNHQNYQEKAVNAAIKIAIERELIHSEQDLLAPEYQSQAAIGLSFFPEITVVYQYKKVVASIFRILFFASLIPIIFGVMNYAEGQMNMTFMGVGLGLIWLGLTFILFKTRKLIVLFLQILLLMIVFIGLGVLLLHQAIFKVTDIAVLVIGTMMLLYMLLYLKKLIQTNPNHLSGQ